MPACLCCFSLCVACLRGSEALKNLVLGGVSAYTIVDGQKVSARDLGNNFLVAEEHLGEAQAECCSRLMQEFNEGASGRYVAETPESLLDRQPEFFRDFTLVLATQLTHAYQVKLDTICRQHGVHVIFGRSYGLFGLVRISTREHHVIESKPENELQVLRIRDPWPELATYIQAFDLTSLDNMTYKHVPYVVLLIKAAGEWARRHGGQPPQDRQSQREFKQFLKDMQRPHPENQGFVDEGENFKEAVENAHYVWSSAASAVPSHLKQYFESESCCNLAADSPPFWVLVQVSLEC